MNSEDKEAIEEAEYVAKALRSEWSEWRAKVVERVIEIAKRAIEDQPENVDPKTLLHNCKECGEFRGHGHSCKPVKEQERITTESKIGDLPNRYAGVPSWIAAPAMAMEMERSSNNRGKVPQ